MPQTPTINARRAKRQDAKFLCSIMATGHLASGRVINLSDTGLCILLSERFAAPPGTKAIVQSPELGRIEATVRWVRDGKVGVEFSLNTNALAQVSSYFRFFDKNDKSGKAEPARRP